MGYIASLTFTDDKHIVHTQSSKVETVDDGIKVLHDALLPLMMSWQDYNPYGIDVEASISSEDNNFWDYYEFKLGM